MVGRFTLPSDSASSRTHRYGMQYLDTYYGGRSGFSLSCSLVGQQTCRGDFVTVGRNHLPVLAVFYEEPGLFLAAHMLPSTFRPSLLVGGVEPVNRLHSRVSITDLNLDTQSFQEHILLPPAGTAPHIHESFHQTAGYEKVLLGTPTCQHWRHLCRKLSSNTVS